MSALSFAPRHGPYLKVPIPAEATLKAALARNAAEGRLLRRLLRLCWARERESRQLAFFAERQEAGQ
jgi:hypothetical protein